MPTYFCTRQRAITEFGGTKALSEALDPNDTGQLDYTVLDQAIENASLMVHKKARNRFKVSLADTPSSIAPYLAMLTAKLAVSEAYELGTRNQARPEMVAKKRAEVMAELDGIESGKGNVGQEDHQPRDRIGRRVDITRGGTRNRLTLAGLRRGFM